MPWDLSPFADIGLDRPLLESLLGEHERRVRPGLERLWSYYRNPIRPAGGVALGASQAAAFGGVPGLSTGPAAGRLAQAMGLPERLRGTLDAAGRPSDSREVVIENDIGWRIETLVDFLFGRPVRIVSLARDEGLRRDIESTLAAAWEASGGLALLQDMALLGCVYGSADLVLREGAEGGELPRVEVVEAPRAVPLLDPGDYRRLLAYLIVADRASLRVEPAGIFERVMGRVRFGAHNGEAAAGTRRASRIVEVLSASHRQVYEDGRLIVDEANALGVLPVVHVQNAGQPFRYEGLSDVEPLIPLQDELNTRLSDRAHRVTLQSFNMYLAKGLDFGGGSAPPRIGPGQVWMTDNPEAEIKAFGGDGDSPSEDRHIDELREALDKTSGVSPVVIGVVRERLGHLSSETAIRVTMTGVLNKTARKRVLYGRGIERMCAMMLASLDRSGALRTDEKDRRVRVEWGEAVPVDERTRLTAAKAKVELGVPAERVLDELGYAPVGSENGAAGAD